MARRPVRRTTSRVFSGRGQFDSPSSIPLGTFLEDGAQDPAGFVHRVGYGQLLTVAPTRAGKSVTTIIPNQPRYRGSVVGELYPEIAAWPAKHVGPVYCIAPFVKGADPETRGFPPHGFRSLARIRAQHQARGLAQLMFPGDPSGQEFFNDDAVRVATGVILWIWIQRRSTAAISAPPARPRRALSISSSMSCSRWRARDCRSVRQPTTRSLRCRETATPRWGMACV
jgi:type IV secretion system protein VirD4